MEITPMICWHCGELVLAGLTAEHTLVVPAHPDRVMPFEECVASARAIPAGNNALR
jgi:hypothetical protein